MRVSRIARICCVAVALAAAQPPGVEVQFLGPYAAAPVVGAFRTSAAHRKDLPAPLARDKFDHDAWLRWVLASDTAIRRRLERGEEDTLTNLLRFGLTFTRANRLDNWHLAQMGKDPVVDAVAATRADDLIRALEQPGSNEGLRQERLFVESRGFSLATPAERQRLKSYLLRNLARMRDEFLAYTAALKDTDLEKASLLYADRGISLDTNLWPHYQIHRELARLAQAGALKPKSVRRVAVVGPGLDFANKELGTDFYPPQSVQPFAVIDTLAQLGLADTNTVELYTFDISPHVNVHLRRAREQARSGKPYVMQLAWNSAVPRSQRYLSGFVPYWRDLGGRVGKPVAATNVPGALAKEINIRAVQVRPAVVLRVQPVDMNVVYQHLVLPEAERFDLIIGTNIFVYYDPFEQSLARANLAAMVRRGGFVLSNDFLADVAPGPLREVARTPLELSQEPRLTDFMFVYRRE